MKRLLKFILLIINIAIVATLLFSGYGGHFSPATSSLPGIALMVFPVVLGSAVFLIIFDLITWRRLAFLPAFGILACASAVWNFCPLNFSTPTLPEGSREFKVLTYNAYNFVNFSSKDSAGYNSTINTILNYDADVVCLQESRPTDPAYWRDVAAQADSLTARYPYRSHGHKSLHLLSKYPFDTIDVRQPDDPSAMFQCVRLNVDGTPVVLYNIHLQSIGLSTDDKALYGSITRHPTTDKLENARYGMIAKLSAAMKARSHQAIMLRHNIDSIGGPNIIVAGDFNDIEDCHAQRIIEGKTLESTFTSVGFGPTVTYYANRFYFNIDHILYGGNLKAMSYERGHGRSSDHYPVMGTFALPVKTGSGNHNAKP